MDTSNRTFVSSVLFLDIVEYSKQSVTEQMALKQRFNTLLVDALKHVAVSDRLVLDTGDGAAVSFLGNPEDSLFAAMRLRDALAAEPVGQTPRLEARFGINLGPVRQIKDINGQMNIIGDGINVAQRVMSFAEPGAILVSRSYYEVVSRLSDDYAKIFSDAGTRTDKHVREHTVYAIGKTLDSVVKTQDDSVSSQKSDDRTNEQLQSGAAVSLIGKVPKGWLLGGGATIALIIGAILLFTNNTKNETAPDTKDDVLTANTAAKPAPHPSSSTNTTTANHTSGSGANAVVPAAKALRSPIILAIQPWGEIYVDGKKKGVSPPLKSLLLTPGTHTIEIRNATFPAYIKTFDVKPGVETRIAHKF